MKDKTLAAIISLFGGFIGLHKLYLGQGGQFIIYLLFCWTGIPAILGFFECFGYLLMSTDRFNRKYNYTTTISSDKFSKFSKFEGMDRLSELLNKGVITQAEYDEGMDELRTPEGKMTKKEIEEYNDSNKNTNKLLGNLAKYILYIIGFVFILYFIFTVALPLSHFIFTYFQSTYF